MSIRKKTARPLSIAELIPQVLGNWRSDPKLSLAALNYQWGEIVGRPLARETHPLHLKGNRLTIAVSNPAWANDLQLLQTTLLARIREVIPEVSEIRFQTRSSG